MGSRSGRRCGWFAQLGVSGALDGQVPDLTARRHRLVPMSQPVALAPVGPIEPARQAAVRASVRHVSSLPSVSIGPAVHGDAGPVLGPYPLLDYQTAGSPLPPLAPLLPWNPPREGETEGGDGISPEAGFVPRVSTPARYLSRGDSCVSRILLPLVSYVPSFSTVLRSFSDLSGLLGRSGFVPRIFLRLFRGDAYSRWEGPSWRHRSTTLGEAHDLPRGSTAVLWIGLFPSGSAHSCRPHHQRAAPGGA